MSNTFYKKIKCIENTDFNTLESQVNKFIKNLDCHMEDIKLHYQFHHRHYTVMIEYSFEE